MKLIFLLRGSNQRPPPFPSKSEFKTKGMVEIPRKRKTERKSYERKDETERPKRKVSHVFSTTPGSPVRISVMSSFSLNYTHNEREWREERGR